MTVQSRRSANLGFEFFAQVQRENRRGYRSWYMRSGSISLKKSKPKINQISDEKAVAVAPGTTIKQWYDKGKVCDNDDNEDFWLYRVWKAYKEHLSGGLCVALRSWVNCSRKDSRIQVTTRTFSFLQRVVIPFRKLYLLKHMYIRLMEIDVIQLSPTRSDGLSTMYKSQLDGQ